MAPRIFYAGCRGLFRGNESRKRLKRGPQKNLKRRNSLRIVRPIQMLCLIHLDGRAFAVFGGADGGAFFAGVKNWGSVCKS